MSILDGPTEPPAHMPTKLKLVLGVYGVSLAFDAWTLTLDPDSTRVLVRMVIAVLVIAFLLRGNDSVRAIVRGFAAIGLVFGVVVLLQALSLGMSTTLGMTAMIAGSVAVGMNAFTVWALGQDDVQLWMATRTFSRVKD